MRDGCHVVPRLSHLLQTHSIRESPISASGENNFLIGYHFKIFLGESALTHKANNTSLIRKVVIESYMYDSYDWNKLKKLKNLEQLTISRYEHNSTTVKWADIAKEVVHGTVDYSPRYSLFSETLTSLMYKGVKVLYVARLVNRVSSPRRCCAMIRNYR